MRNHRCRTLEKRRRDVAGGDDRVHPTDQPPCDPGVVTLRRRGENQFQRPAERSQQHAGDHLVVAPRVPDQRRAAAPQSQQISDGHPRHAVGRIGTQPRRTKQSGEFRRHHPVGRGDAGIAPVQIRYDQLQIVSGNALDSHARLHFAHFLYATLSIVASSLAPKPTLHRGPDSIALNNREMGELMTVLVTGGAGYIGSHMVHALVEAGESVVVIDNLSTGFSTFLPEGVPLFIGDAADENLVEGVIAAHEVESIIHFAGSVVVPDSMRDPLAYYRNNTMTTRNLLNVAVKSGVNRFIFSSTAAVYGNPDQVPVPENTPTRPLSPYGSSKLMTEIMLSDGASAHGMNYAVLRYFNVAGADPLARIGLATVGATHLLKIAVEAATGQRAKLDVFGTES